MARGHRLMMKDQANKLLIYVVQPQLSSIKINGDKYLHSIRIHNYEGFSCMATVDYSDFMRFNSSIKVSHKHCSVQY